MENEYSSLLKACGCDPYGVYNENGILIDSFETLEDANKFVEGGN